MSRLLKASFFHLSYFYKDQILFFFIEVSYKTLEKFENYITPFLSLFIFNYETSLYVAFY